MVQVKEPSLADKLEADHAVVWKADQATLKTAQTALKDGIKEEEDIKNSRISNFRKHTSEELGKLIS
jgi:hypothetical protein